MKTRNLKGLIARTKGGSYLHIVPKRALGGSGDVRAYCSARPFLYLEPTEVREEDPDLLCRRCLATAIRIDKTMIGA